MANTKVSEVSSKASCVRASGSAAPAATDRAARPTPSRRSRQSRGVTTASTRDAVTASVPAARPGVPEPDRGRLLLRRWAPAPAPRVQSRQSSQQQRISRVSTTPRTTPRVPNRTRSARPRCGGSYTTAHRTGNRATRRSPGVRRRQPRPERLCGPTIDRRRHGVGVHIPPKLVRSTLRSVGCAGHLSPNRFSRCLGRSPA